MRVVLFAGLVIIQACASPLRSDSGLAEEFEFRVELSEPESSRKAPGTDIFTLHLALENRGGSEATVFLPDLATRPELGFGARFAGRREGAHPYAVRVIDAAGRPIPGAAFSPFVGGIAGGPPAQVVEYDPARDLVRLAPGDRLRRHLGYVMVPKSGPRPVTVEVTLETNPDDESDPVALELIRSAGGARKFTATATSR